MIGRVRGAFNFVKVTLGHIIIRLLELEEL